jgi:CRP-like cAMP-binding protein
MASNCPKRRMDFHKRVGEFFLKFPEFHYSKGGVIINDGEENRRVFFLVKGIVREYFNSQTGNQFTVNIYNPESFFPLCFPNRNAPDTNCFDAVTPCTVRIAPAESFLRYLGSDRELLILFTGELLNNLSHLTKRLGVIASGNAYQRTASAIVYLGKILGKRAGSNGGIIINDPYLSHKEIAGWVGIARETTSIQMKLLEKKGLVKYLHRRIFISDLESLNKEAG